MEGQHQTSEEHDIMEPISLILSPHANVFPHVSISPVRTKRRFGVVWLRN